jgi:hypothetical protein
MQTGENSCQADVQVIKKSMLVKENGERYAQRATPDLTAGRGKRMKVLIGRTIQTYLRKQIHATKIAIISEMGTFGQ